MQYPCFRSCRWSSADLSGGRHRCTGLDLVPRSGRRTSPRFALLAVSCRASAQISRLTVWGEVMDQVDGNAIGGTLHEVFGAEMTGVHSVCGRSTLGGHPDDRAEHPVQRDSEWRPSR
jgi:hypothetical protein